MKAKIMKLNKFGNLLVIGLVLTIAASGCRKKPVGVTSLPGQPVGKVSNPEAGGAIPPGTTVTEPSGVGSRPATDTGGFPINPDLVNWIPDRETLKADTVHFDFDSSVLKSSEKPNVAKVADYLKANTGKAVRVEGNCDERGTEEYNRSLGERRALAVREELIRLGIDPSHIDTIGYGKDKPVDPGHTESAWSQNRRDDFVVLSPPK
jgi:peptidoglycan-associated lipoprotein